MSPEVEYVEVQLELGHTAVPKSKPGTDFTHQWTLFVRGPDDCKIEEFVDRVVFNLHESFEKPRRSFREPPFSVREFGYAGFELPIDIYFKNKEEPKKITYEYDLFLQTHDSVHNTRREKLTFQNPSPDFKKKLLRAGGKCYSDPKEKTAVAGGAGHAAAAKSKAKAASPLTPASHPAAASPGPDAKAHAGQRASAGKHRVPQKDIPAHPATAVPSATPAAAPAKQIREKPAVAKPDPFTALFGPPLQCRPSPDPAKQKERSRKDRNEQEAQTKAKEKEPAHSSKAHAADTSVKSSSRLPSPGHSHAKGEKCGKRCKSKTKKKKDSRCSSSSSQNSDAAVHNDSSRKCDSKVKSKAESGEDRRTKVKGKDIRSVAAGVTGASTSSQKSKDVKKENFTSTTISFSNNNNTGTTTFEIKSVKKEKTWDSESKKSKKEFVNEESETGAAEQRAASSSPTSDANGAPARRDDAASSCSAGSRRKKCESGSDSDADATRDKKWKCDSDGDEENRSLRRDKHLTDLLWVQKRINETTDPILLQRVVDMIENSSSAYEVTKNSFDFDLRRLDSATLFRLVQIVERG